MVARIAFDGVSIYGRQFSSTSPEFGTSGSFDKCWLREEDGPHLIKRGSDGYANAGFEPYAEKLCSDILDAAYVSHVPYTLRNYHGKLASGTTRSDSRGSIIQKVMLRRRGRRLLPAYS